MNACAEKAFSERKCVYHHYQGALLFFPHEQQCVLRVSRVCAHVQVCVASVYLYVCICMCVCVYCVCICKCVSVVSVHVCLYVFCVCESVCKSACLCIS